MQPEQARSAMEEILEKLRQGKAPDPASARDEILHTVACKAAIKAGWDTDNKELEKLAEAVLSGKVKYCPHGRPVVRQPQPPGAGQALQAHRVRRPWRTK